MKETIKVSSGPGWGELEININVYSIEQLVNCANSLEHAAREIRRRVDSISKGHKLDPHIYAEIRKECCGTVFHRHSGDKFNYEDLNAKTYIVARVRDEALISLSIPDEWILRQVENVMYRLKKQRRILDEETAAMRCKQGDIDVPSLKAIAMLEFNKAGFFQNPEDVYNLVDEYLSTPLRDMHVVVAEAVETLRERDELYRVSRVSGKSIAKLAIIKEVRRIANCGLLVAKDATEHYIAETKLGQE